MYHKEPGRASFFVNKEPWKEVKKYNPNLILAHARGASKGMGEPNINKNNHPFTSLNKSIALVHNGKVDDLEYRFLRQKYGALSNCDSEIILRIFEAGETYETDDLKDFLNEEYPQRLAGIRDVFSQINRGHMAVAIGERAENGDRILWLFRNCHRPLWIIDAREVLGQIFFVSDPNIWDAAVAECKNNKSIIKSQKLIELPEDEIWQFKLPFEQTVVQNVKRYLICRKKYTTWQFDGKKIEPERKDSNFNVVTQLDSNDKIIDSYFDHSKLPLKEFHQKCNEIINEVNHIRNFVLQNNYLNPIDVEQLVSQLEEKREEIQMLIED